MAIRRVIEVWEKGMDGAPVGHWPVADTVKLAFLSRLFADEQYLPDPEMLLSYLLDRRKVAALQPYVAQQMRVDEYDFILSTHRADEGRSADVSAGEEPFD